MCYSYIPMGFAKYGIILPNFNGFWWYLVILYNNWLMAGIR